MTKHFPLTSRDVYGSRKIALMDIQSQHNDGEKICLSLCCEDAALVFVFGKRECKLHDIVYEDGQYLLGNVIDYHSSTEDMTQSEWIVLIGEYQRLVIEKNKD